VEVGQVVEVQVVMWSGSRGGPGVGGGRSSRVSPAYSSF